MHTLGLPLQSLGQRLPRCATRQFFFQMAFDEARSLAPELFEPLGTIRREPVRPYDDLRDPLLTPSEEIAARTRDLANLPVGACYWLIKRRRFKARRIQVRAPMLSQSST